MGELEIKDVDESGNVIENIDWSKWRRIRVDEVMDNGKVVELISHCVRIPQEEIDEKRLIELQQKLTMTDYISAKFGDLLMACNSVEEMNTVMADFQNEYGTIIAKRQEWRDQINELRSVYSIKNILVEM